MGQETSPGRLLSVEAWLKIHLFQGGDKSSSKEAAGLGVSDLAMGGQIQVSSSL
jgi:hypothetical protein